MYEGRKDDRASVTKENNFSWAFSDDEDDVSRNSWSKSSKKIPPMPRASPR